MYTYDQEAKEEFYSNLNPTCVTDNKRFWKTVKPLFSEKVLSNENFILINANVIVEDPGNVSENLNEVFGNAIKNLHIGVNPDIINDTDNESDPILRAINKYKNIIAS